MKKLMSYSYVKDYNDQREKWSESEARKNEANSVDGGSNMLAMGGKPASR
jgi:hypothetical protein